MEILDGKAVSEKIRLQIRSEVEAIRSSGKRAPHLAAILVGNNGASETYVNAKVKACKEVGFDSTLLRFEESISQEKLLSEINRLNNDPSIDGYIVQLPLPSHIKETTVIEAISPEKDVDGFHPVNVGKTALNLPSFLPATPYGIIQLLEHYNVETSGKHCVVVGRSNIVGMPVSLLMMRNSKPGNATVTVCHSRTTDLNEIVKSADIIIAALGKPLFITAEMVKEGAVVIDVGITRVDDPTRKSGFRLAGDVDFENVSSKASFITPVPGGVGPMTIVSLLKNTLQAYRK